MKVIHRGYEIDVIREPCLGGWPMLYYSIYRLDDGKCFLDTFEDSDEKVRDMIKYMKQRIDAELALDDPWLEKQEKQLQFQQVETLWNSLPDNSESHLSLSYEHFNQKEKNEEV